jgi:hypothetical protein
MFKIRPPIPPTLFGIFVEVIASPCSDYVIKFIFVKCHFVRHHQSFQYLIYITPRSMDISYWGRGAVAPSQRAACNSFYVTAYIKIPNASEF